MPTLYYSDMQWNDKQVIIAATDNGLCYVGTFIHDEADLIKFATKHYRTYTVEKDHSKLEPYRNQLNEFVEGNRKTFDLPIEVQSGTVFQQKVWEALRLIPYGTTTTYSTIAQMIEKPSAVRAVANAIGKNPLTIIIPCHRVIGKNGHLTGFAGGLEMKRFLLQVEQRIEK